MARILIVLLPALLGITLLTDGHTSENRLERGLSTVKTVSMMIDMDKTKTAVASISEMLDDFHDAAAHADATRYFGHFAQNAVFLGTAPDERWTLEAFKKWAKPYFKRDVAWTYIALERHVQIGPDGKTGWFDEVVHNKTYGDLRGTGVVVWQNGKWKLAQYNLAFPIPNAKVESVLKILHSS